MNLIHTIQELAARNCGPQNLADKIKSCKMPVNVNAKESPIGAFGVLVSSKMTPSEVALDLGRLDFLLLLLAHGARDIHNDIKNFFFRLIHAKVACSSRFVSEVLGKYFSDTPIPGSFFDASLTPNQIISLIMLVVLKTQNVLPHQLSEALLVALSGADNPELCKFLLESGAKPAWQHVMAAISGHASIDVMRLLLKNNSVAYARDAEGNTLLHHAAWCDRADLVELLLEKDFMMALYTNHYDQTPVEIAAQQGSYRMGHALLGHKCVASPNFLSIMEPITLETYRYVIGFFIAYLQRLIETNQCAVFFESIKLYSQYFDTTDHRHIDFLFSARHGLLAYMVCYSRFDFLEKLLDQSRDISITWNDLIYFLKQDRFEQEKKAFFIFSCDYYARTEKWSQYMSWLYHFSDHKPFATLFCEQVKDRESIIQKQAKQERQQLLLCSESLLRQESLITAAHKAADAPKRRERLASMLEQCNFMRQEYNLLRHPDFNRATLILTRCAALRASAQSCDSAANSKQQKPLPMGSLLLFATLLPSTQLVLPRCSSTSALESLTRDPPSHPLRSSSAIC